ncbi:MAG TPA: 3-phosphoshikimate 1-carboxyvinyltransferase [Acidimicrobiales bacterium]|nr:3-phosphoshikimate 1-carboxyvinyltransferase [Acidimicrobiales bacterium]
MSTSGLVVQPFSAPPDAEVAVPGSKSITNRALVAAGLAEGTSRLSGVLRSDDTDAMVDALRTLGIAVRADDGGTEVSIDGGGGRVPSGPADLDARLSGTTSRFLTPMVALGSGRYRIDGGPPMRARPMTPLVEAVRSLGGRIEEEGAPGHLPFTVVADGLRGGAIEVSGDISSQFLSALLLSGPAMAEGLEVRVTTALVSRPYVAMTLTTMADFGVEVAQPDDTTFLVPPASYRGTDVRIEPDASAASYFFAAAAITGGRVRVPGLGRRSTQGDLAFVEVLERMGAIVRSDDEGTEVVGTGALRGVDVDLTDLSDTAQTLAATAVFATGPTRVRGIGFIRRKETDRIAAVVRELRRCGIEAEEHPDGFSVHPGTPRPARIETYHDHRMAMSFALLGLRAPGIEILDPACVEKTYPEFFADLDRLRSSGPGGR